MTIMSRACCCRAGARTGLLTAASAPFRAAVEEHCNVQSLRVPAASYPFLTETHTGDALPAFWQPLHMHFAALARQAGVRTYFTGQLGDLIMGNWADDSDQVAGLLRQ